MKRLFVIAVASEKGGVGKTTIATNLAVYLKALREDLPVTIASFDNHFSVDQMFALVPPSERNVAALFEESPPTDLVRLGQYGVQYIASSRRLQLPHHQPAWLRQRLNSMDLYGILIL
ncbi:MAG: P-loop NTPase, partial [Desulfuromonadales bacterium]